MGSMTRRGETYLRTLLVPKARAALVQCHGHNTAVVAVANKNVRILWAGLTTDECYRSVAATSGENEYFAKEAIHGFASRRSQGDQVRPAPVHSAPSFFGTAV